ncbi:MAG TPA: NAD(P)/FAD-dependent oxidoreductase, partial [Flavisolibacter sp.]|nr:NAD(P)/FAD-dependent oxidoreductase [Flavisolibacter sp.]
FCAITVARLCPGLKVTILEKSSKLLSKVKVSGGGRCNVTHAIFDMAEISRRYPRGQNFVKKSFHQFSATDTIKWFQERGVAIKTEKDGRMFPATDSSQTIIDCLMNEAHKYGVEIRMNTDVKDLKTENGSWRLTVGNGQILQANYVVIATGAYPKSTMFQWLKDLGHTIAEPVPSLFTFNLPKHPINGLMGISVENVSVKVEGSKLVETGPLLITHWGLSGPAVLRLSAWGARELAGTNYDFKAHINWLPGYTDQGLKKDFAQFRTLYATRKISNHNFGNLPGRLWQFLLDQSGIKEDMRFADLPAKSENTLIKNLVDYTVEVKGKTTFKEEFVTAGGINLSEVDVTTMMSKKSANLFFVGEVLDVDGITGGFNFQHAWTSGWIAAHGIRALV